MMMALRLSSRCHRFLSASVKKVHQPVTLHKTLVQSVGFPFTSDATGAPFPNDPDIYKRFKTVRKSILQSRLEHSNRFQQITTREDRSDWPAEVRKEQIPAKWITVYRGCEILKTPEDFETYHQLFWYIRPATVIELGTYTGGMTIWMADTMKLIDNPCHIYTFDLDNSLLDDVARKLKPENVTFLQGDSYAIEKTFKPSFIEQLPHPWVVIEDAHENTTNVLKHFHQFMKQGDYLVVEDTDPNIPEDFPSNPEEMFEKKGTPVGPKKLEKVKSFLREYVDYYSVDSFFTDLYGYNGLCHWHGFIKRMK